MSCTILRLVGNTGAVCGRREGVLRVQSPPDYCGDEASVYSYGCDQQPWEPGKGLASSVHPGVALRRGQHGGDTRRECDWLAGGCRLASLSRSVRVELAATLGSGRETKPDGRERVRLSLAGVAETVTG